MSPLSSETLTLRQFLLRQRTLKMYKQFMATVARIEDTQQQTDTRKWIRDEFKANKHHKDEKVIEMHLSRAETALKELQTMIAFSGAANTNK